MPILYVHARWHSQLTGTWKGKTMDDINRRERMLRELASDLADLVADGEITDVEANQWLADKADQWANGVQSQNEEPRRWHGGASFNPRKAKQC